MRLGVVQLTPETKTLGRVDLNFECTPPYSSVANS